MNLDNVTAELRPRSEWEATDLGARMIRRDASTIYAVWFALTLPLFLLACLGLVFVPSSGWIPIAYWWLEPLADGAILHIISRRLFGEQVGVGATLREVPRLALRNIIFLLPPYRFHFARSAAIPITQLEGLKGKRRRERAGVINSRIMNFGIGVTAAYQHLFLALYIGTAILLFALIPVSYQDDIGVDWFDRLFWNQSSTVGIAQLTLTYIAQSVLHPWFVGAGFGLYINCRTRLEAWDLEVSFRRMVNRRGHATALALLVILPFTLLDPASAQETEDAVEDASFVGYWDAETVAAAIEEVYVRDELQTEQQVRRWRSKNETEESDLPDLDFSFFENIGRILAFVVEIWLWLLVVAALLLIFATRDLWLPLLKSQSTQRQQRVVLSSGEIREDTLPENIPEEVQRLWKVGQRRAALSLLFRASVFYVVMRHDVTVPPSATEKTCIEAVRSQQDTELSAHFEQVVMAWVLCAYGSIEPDEEKLRRLCADWSKHFGAAGRTTP